MQFDGCNAASRTLAIPQTVLLPARVAYGVLSGMQLA
jgi:hypothetical protein